MHARVNMNIYVNEICFLKKDRKDERKVVNIYRLAQSERVPTSGSPKAEVGEIDSRAPFHSVKASVSLFGEVAVTKERRTPRKSRISAENVIDKETQLLLAEKEFNHIKQKLESDEATKAKADSELESAKQTLQELSEKLKAVTESKQYTIEAAEAVKQHGTEFDPSKSQHSQEYETQDFDAALEVKLAAFQQADDAHLSAKMHSERATELTKQIVAMKEAIKQVKFATQQVYNEQETIAEEKEMLKKPYEATKEEAEKKFSASREVYDPELTKFLEQKLMETTAELNKATMTLQMVAGEECSLWNLVSSIRVELEEVKMKQAQQNAIKANKEAKRESLNDHNVRLQQLLLEAETARKEAEEMKKIIETLKKEGEVAEMTVMEVEENLKVIEEIKAATELAEKSAMMAEAAQNMIEGELRRRCQQEEEALLLESNMRCGSTILGLENAAAVLNRCFFINLSPLAFPDEEPTWQPESGVKGSHGDDKDSSIEWLLVGAPSVAALYGRGDSEVGAGVAGSVLSYSRPLSPHAVREAPHPANRRRRFFLPSQPRRATVEHSRDAGAINKGHTGWVFKGNEEEKGLRVFRGRFCSPWPPIRWPGSLCLVVAAREKGE
ncbi:Detected protein of confused Function [Hibiscus syriacus]|uniref:Detected protein of confused Function n=1 Tax=Hibiscus syriacus TaxID=106335 RepID=A0A6A3CH17_HIBSY|nr:Detected protein of confused Function [Hibiscus syriacus]